MKFKVGDRVEAIKKEPKGKIGTIVRIWSDNCGAEVVFDDWKYGWGENGRHYNVQNDEIKLIKQNQFTKSDLKDGDIVTYRNVEMATFVANKFYKAKTGEEVGNNYNKELNAKYGKEFDIIKVERPTNYETVFERKEEILDEVEKRYLRNVIRPFKNEIEAIRKVKCIDSKERIVIDIKDELNTLFPKFEKGTIYKNMKADKSYTLKELGL